MKSAVDPVKKVVIIGANSILAQAIHSKLKNYFLVYQVYNNNKYRIEDKTNLIDINTFKNSSLNFNYIFFISAVIDYRETLESMEKIFYTNVHLLKFISNKFPEAKIIHASSVSLYKEKKQPVMESDELELTSSYQISKHWGENIVTNHAGGGVNIRISSLFGEAMNVKSFLPYIIKNAIENNKIILFGDGRRKQNYIDAKEAALYFCAAMDYKESHPLLAVNSNSYSNLEIAEIIRTCLGDIDIEFKGKDDSPSFIYDNTNTRQKLNILDKSNFKEQIQKTIIWMQKQS